MEQLKLVALVGSLRKDSYNLQLAQAAQKLLESRASLEILDYSQVPFFNEDLEFPTPEPVARLRAQVKAADGVWFFTPEYNHSFPGVLKNVIDWLSRPMWQGKGQVLSGKAAVVSGAGLAPIGTAIAQDQLIMLLNLLNMEVMNIPRVTVGQVHLQLDEAGKLALSADSLGFLEKQANRFLSFVEKRRANQ